MVLLASPFLAHAAAAPNFVLILADDLGYGDVGCYGATKIKTPNIDRLASEGVRFTQAYTPGSVCSPTRYGLMAGRYFWREPRHHPTGVHAPGGPLLFDLSRLTLAKLFQKKGYATGAFGKCHLTGLLSAAAALAIYASQHPPPPDAVQALLAARRAADYLLGIRHPKDAAWAFHPPTYHPTMFQDRLRGHMVAERHMTLCGAETGLYYLDVHAATGDRKYLDAAVRIAETYARRQTPEGSWPLFVTAKDNQPVTDNVLILTSVITFLDRLGRVTGDRRFEPVRDNAIAWIEKYPVRTWNWQGQFEDVKPQPPYQNLTKHEACDFAIHLLETAPQDQARRALALDLLRFAEDQFVIWAQPPAETPLKQNPDGESGARRRGWMLPCVLEQYRCYAPVCASSAKLICTYLAAYDATGDRLHLEKAKGLAATLARTQSNRAAPGRYLTWVMQPSGPMWFNCELMAIRAVQELARIDP